MLLNNAVIPMWALVLTLSQRLKNADDNLGAQFKINTQPKWKGTIGIRCNHVFLESVASYVDQAVKDLALRQAFPLLEHISISKAFATDPTTTRKRSVPWKRTLFITLRPGRELYALLVEKLPSAQENYRELDTLITVLEELKRD